jgi:hypothetical protein
MLRRSFLAGLMALIPIPAFASIIKRRPKSDEIELKSNGKTIGSVRLCAVDTYFNTDDLFKYDGHYNTYQKDNPESKVKLIFEHNGRTFECRMTCISKIWEKLPVNP